MSEDSPKNSCDHRAPAGLSRREFNLFPLAATGLAAFGQPVWAAEAGYRRTLGIVTDNALSDPWKEADVIMTAAVLGFAANYIQVNKKAIQFDMDPADTRNEAEWKTFQEVVGRVDKSVTAWLKKKGGVFASVASGTSEKHEQGGIIMGVYKLAGQTAPLTVNAPAMSGKGEALYKKIATLAITDQYIGRGAYTGFVDNPNGDPIGPLSTVRLEVPDAGKPAPEGVVPHSRWLPRGDSKLWADRKRKDGTIIPWGLIVPRDKATRAVNASEEPAFTKEIEKEGMKYIPETIPNEHIAGYTHGMIQAIYKAYHLGPKCEPYEIAVGNKTTKLASCFPCTMFMHAVGYPPTSIHLGSGESWAPLYHTYDPAAPQKAPGPGELAVIRDLNNSWYEKCLLWVQTGLDILDNTAVMPTHTSQRNFVADYLRQNAGDKTVAGVLILDAITMHKKEIDRLRDTLKA